LLIEVQLNANNGTNESTECRTNIKNVNFLFPIHSSFKSYKFSVLTYVIFFKIKLYPQILADKKIIPGLNSIFILKKPFLLVSFWNSFLGIL